MQFLDNGPDIPTELLEAQERGGAVFVCGAGVSRAVGLPSFKGLVEAVYDALGETWKGQPAEAPWIEGPAPALDRALFALQTRMGGTDPRMAANARSRVMNAVQAALTLPPRTPLPDHLNLLRLSRDADMRPRLITTNFDVLFEQAWQESRGFPLPSRAVADMPGPGSADFSGVLHLHGRLGHIDLGLSRTDLVLNSAEFGEAYLRAGWASRYVYDLARASTIVMVGYGAEDPPVRYLLEVLSADRTRFRDLGKIYSFVPTGAFGDRNDIEAQWGAQGIVPLAYEAPTFTDHSALYRTLAEWAEYAEDPTAWRRGQARRIMARSPDTLSPGDWVSLGWALGRGDASRILHETNPDPVWFAPLKSNGIFERARPGAWIEQRLGEREMFEAALQNEAIDRVTAEDLQFALGRAQLPDDLARAWRLLLQNRAARQTQWDDGWFDVRRRLAGGDVGLDVRRHVAKLFTPRPKARPVFAWPEEVEVERETRLMDVRYGGPVHADPVELLGLWPPAEDAALLRTLIRALEDTLEEAADHGFTGQGFDRASFQVKSVAPHAQDSLREGFYPIIRIVADLLARLAAASPDAARSAAEQLAGQSYNLSQRLYLHALTLPGLFDPRSAAQHLLDLNDQDFWVSDLRREVMRLAALRWAEFDEADRLALETRIAAGPPRALFVDDPGMEEQVAGVIERETFLRLGRQEHLPPGLGAAAAARLTALRVANPKWELEVDERADFSSWSETRAGAQGEPELLDDVAADNLVAQATALAEADPWRQGEIWRKFVAADPARAFEGLVARAQAGEWPSAAWIPFFWALNELDDPDLERRVVAALADAELDALTGIATSVSSWMVRRAGLPSVSPEDRIALWDQLVDALVTDPREDEGETSDRAFDILNRAPGHLARLLVHEIGQLGVEDGAGVPQAFRQRLDRVVDLTGARAAIGVAALGRSLPLLHRLDPEWCESRLIPFFMIDHEWAPAMWVQLATVGRWRNALFTVLRPAFLATFGAPQRFEAASENLVFHLLQMARDRVGGAAEEAWLTLAECKAALSATSADWRRHASFQLFREIEDTAQDARARHWRDVLGPLFRGVWPMAPALQSTEATYYLTGMALRTGDAFPEAVSAITPAVVGPGRDGRDALAMIRDEHSALLKAHPRAGLELLDALVDGVQLPRDLGAWLDDLVAVEPALRTEMRFERLLGIARRAQA